jgi:hypothetical protein
MLFLFFYEDVIISFGSYLISVFDDIYGISTIIITNRNYIAIAPTYTIIYVYP